MPYDYSRLFDLAPVSLWLEDYSQVLAYFDELRESGVTDLRTHAYQHPHVVRECSERIRLLEVNRRTLTLFAADSFQQLVENLERVFRDDMFEQHLHELACIWEGHREFHSETVNYTLDGRRLDIQLHGQVLPGHEARWDRVLVSIEDVTERARTERALRRSRQYAQGLFQHSPVSLWVEDFSAVRMLLHEVREGGITDFRTFLNVHPDFVARCMSEIRVLEVNQQTLTLFGAPSQDALLSRLGDVFRDDMQAHFAEQLIDLWNEKLWQQREVVNYGLDGRPINVFMQWSVFPGCEENWDRVLVSLTDITSRKKAEAYLEFLGKHDVLTKLYNRSFYEDELARLDRRGPWPVSIVAIDLNGLKAVNDLAGHADGDALLRRTGEVLRQAVGRDSCVARTGGDEFMLLLPSQDALAAQGVVDQIHKLVELNNQFYPGSRLSLSIGAATGTEGCRLNEIVKLADDRMYEAKRQHYQRGGQDRRADPLLPAHAPIERNGPDAGLLHN